MAIQPEQPSHSPSMDLLYCEEERWVDDEDEEEEHEHQQLQQLELEQDLVYEDEELSSLFEKEREQHRSHVLGAALDNNKSLSEARRGAVDWMLQVISGLGFSTLTGILGLNYLDRFLATFCYQEDQPWMIQITAVACISLAAKVEETQVPLLLELQQVVESQYMFKAKDIQSMELLVLSTLKWKMHPVTPISFADHIVRRLGLRNHLHLEFLRRCERLLLCLSSDSRSVVYLPSVLATATMMRVIDQVEPFHSLEYQNQLLGVLEITKLQDEVNGCYELIQELSVTRTKSSAGDRSSLKRKNDQHQQLTASARSPSGVIDAVLSCDSSNDSWAVGYGGEANIEAEEKLEQKQQPLFKRSRTQDQWLFVDIVGTRSSSSSSS